MNPYRIEDERIDPPVRPNPPEIPARKMHVLIEIDPPNVDDMAGESVAEIEAAMEQRTGHIAVLSAVRVGCFDIISVAAVEAVKRKKLVGSELCMCGHNMSDHLVYSAECYFNGCTCRKFMVS
jgi:hypothetical protein